METPSIRPRRALVAEDDGGHRELVRRCLEGLGYRVVACADGLEACRALASGGPFDLVVTDLQMPGAPGEMVVAAAREGTALGESVRVVVMTGGAAGAPPGCDAFLRKPFPCSSLRAAVSR